MHVPCWGKNQMFSSTWATLGEGSSIWVYLFLYLFGSQKRENIQFHKGKKLYEKWIEIWITFWPEWAKRTRARKLFISRSISNKVFFLYEIVYSPNLRYKQVERQFYDMITIYTYTYHVKLALSNCSKEGRKRVKRNEWNM